MQKSELRELSFTKRLVLLFLGIFFIAIIAVISQSTNSQIHLVFIGFLPTALFLMITFAFLDKINKDIKYPYLFGSPFLLVIIFLLAGFAKLPIFNNFDIFELAVLNLILSYTFSFFLYFIDIHKEDEVKNQVVFQPQNKPKITQENLRDVLQTIEDKCKAINFVIGRVYGEKKGGSKLIRSQIRINKDWYNKFSDLAKSYNPKEIEYMKLTLNLILERLRLLNKQEKQIFAKQANKLTNLQRDESGNDRILDVLIRNDKDPVEAYVKGAKNSITAILNFLTATHPKQ